MKLIAHRGFWKKKTEQNKLFAFERSIKNNFGIELDIRDCNRQIVISHDMPYGSEIKLEDCFRRLSKERGFKTIQFAINIKSDGIEEEIARLLLKYGIERNSFVFDMSASSTYIFRKFHKKINFAARHSDIEKEPLLYNLAKWVWMDELERSWIDIESICRHVKNGKRICIVSPELHKRPYQVFWERLYFLPKDYSDKVYLCTDLPYLAHQFFNRVSCKNDKSNNI